MMVQNEYDFITCLAKKREWVAATLFFLLCNSSITLNCKKHAGIIFYDVCSIRHTVRSKCERSRDK